LAEIPRLYCRAASFREKRLLAQATMARKEHNKAAEHHENAAKSHRAAAELHGKGEHTKGVEQSKTAQFADCGQAERSGSFKEPTAEVKRSKQERPGSSPGLFN
jgi:hypothetical protein